MGVLDDPALGLDGTTPVTDAAWSDWGRVLAAGTMSIPQAAVGLLHPLVNEEGKRALAGTQAQINQIIDDQMRGLSTEGFAQYNASVLPGEGQNIFDVGAIRALALKGVASLPPMAMTAVPAGIVARGLLAAGMTASTANIGASAVGALAEGALGAGQTYADIADAIRSAPDQELAASPIYQQMLANGADPVNAREAFIEMVGLTPAIASFITSAATGAVTGNIAGKAATSGMRPSVGSIGGEILKDTGAEAGAEAVQNSTQDLATQAGINQGLGRPIDLAQTAEATAQGAVMGGLMGGGVSAMGAPGALTARRSQPAVGIPSTAEPVSDPQAVAPGQGTTAAPPAPVNAVAGTSPTAGTPATSQGLAAGGGTTVPINGAKPVATTSPIVIGDDTTAMVGGAERQALAADTDVTATMAPSNSGEYAGGMTELPTRTMFGESPDVAPVASSGPQAVSGGMVEPMSAGMEQVSDEPVQTGLRLRGGQGEGLTGGPATSPAEQRAAQPFNQRRLASLEDFWGESRDIPDDAAAPTPVPMETAGVQRELPLPKPRQPRKSLKRPKAAPVAEVAPVVEVPLEVPVEETSVEAPAGNPVITDPVEAPVVEPVAAVEAAPRLKRGRKAAPAAPVAEAAPVEVAPVQEAPAPEKPKENPRKEKLVLKRKEGAADASTAAPTRSSDEETVSAKPERLKRGKQEKPTSEKPGNVIDIKTRDVVDVEIDGENTRAVVEKVNDDGTAMVRYRGEDYEGLEAKQVQKSATVQLAAMQKVSRPETNSNTNKADTQARTKATVEEALSRTSNKAKVSIPEALAEAVDLEVQARIKAAKRPLDESDIDALTLDTFRKVAKDSKAKVRIGGQSVPVKMAAPRTSRAVAEKRVEGPVAKNRLRRSERVGTALEDKRNGPRGAEQISNRMRNQRRAKRDPDTGRTAPDTDFSDAAIRMVDRFIADVGPEMFEDVGLSIRRGDPDGPQGEFEPYTGIVTMFEGVNPEEAGVNLIHELWHSLARKLSDADVDAVRAEYMRQKEKWLRKNPELRVFNQGRTLRGPQARAALRNNPMVRAHPDVTVSTENGQIVLRLRNTPENYRFLNLDEYFAETLTEKYQDQLEGHSRTFTSVWNAMREMLKRLFDAVAQRFGRKQTDRILDQFRAGRMGRENQRDWLTASGWDGREASGTRPFLARNIGNTPQSVTQAVTNAISSVAPNGAMDRLVTANDRGLNRVRPAILGAKTLDGIVLDYKRAFQTATGNPLTDYAQAEHEQLAMAREAMTRANPLHRQWSEAARRDGEGNRKLGDVMVAATMYGVHPDEDATSQSNVKILAKDAALRTVHGRLKAEFDALPAEFKQIYRDARQYFADRQEEVARDLVTYLVRSDLQRDPQTASGNAMMVRQGNVDVVDEGALAALVNGYMSSGQMPLWAKGIIGETGMGELDEIRTMKHRVAPYFPLHRNGEFVVFGESKGEQEFANKDDLAEFMKNYPGAKVTRTTDLPNGGVRADIKITNTHFFETQREAEQFRTRLTQDAQYQGLTDVLVSKVTQRQHMGQEDRWDFAFKGTLSRVEERVGKTEGAEEAARVAAELRHAFIQLMPKRYLGKSWLARRGITGASSDMLRTFAADTNAAAFYLGRLKSSWKSQAAIKGMRAHASEVERGAVGDPVQIRQVINELQRRSSNQVQAIQANRIEQVASDLGMVYYLGSLSYTLVNMLQLPSVALPWLAARPGNSVMKAGIAMTEAMRMVGGPAFHRGLKETGKAFLGKLDEHGFNVFEDVVDKVQRSSSDPGLAPMLRAVAREGLIDMGFNMDMRMSAQTDTDSYLNGSLRSKLNPRRALRYAADTVRMLPHAVEVANRATVAIAAYQLAKQSGKGGNEAIEAAKDAVRQTMWDYSHINKPRWTNIPFGRVIFQFKQYAFNMYGMLLRSMRESLSDPDPEVRATARKTFVGVMLGHGAMAGTLGMAFEPFKILLGLGGLIAGDDDPWDIDTDWRNFLTDMVGPTAGEILARGPLRYATGIDLSTRVSLQNLMVRSDQFGGLDSSKDMASLIGEQIAGPMGSLIGKPIDAMNYLRQGDGQRALEALSPKALRDVVSAFGMAKHGLQDTNGMSIADSSAMTPWDLAIKAIGFQPRNVAERMEARRAITASTQWAQKARSNLMERYWREDASGRLGAMSDIQEFNRENPDYAISRGQLAQSMGQRKRREKEMVMGAQVRKGQEKSAREAARFANF